MNYIRKKPILIKKIFIYFKMIASYLVFAHLFNTYCAAKIEKSWNTNIGNEFVYFYKKTNEQERHENTDLRINW